MQGHVHISMGFNANCDRYYFDNRLQVAEGWFPIVTGQDAPYFGCWTHPGLWKIYTFAEGDATFATYPDGLSYREGLVKALQFYSRDCRMPAFIDCLTRPIDCIFRQRLYKYGMGSYLR